MTLFTDALKSNTKAFCLNTSQHGFKFIFLSRRTLLERIIWVLVIIACLIAITIYSILIYGTYANQGSTITTDTTHNPIWHYHFPAVTICSVNKISLDLVEKHAGLFKKFNNTNYNVNSFKKDLHYLHQLIYPNNRQHFSSLPRLQKVLDQNNLTAAYLLDLLSPKCANILRCNWKGDIRKCGVLFKRTLTVFGFCCSFNYLAVNDETTNHHSPHRISQCNFKSALQILINIRPSNYGAYDMKTYGVSVFVHHPYEYVDWSTEFVLLPQSTTNFVSVTPQITDVSQDLVSVNPKHRNCLMGYERKLDKFRVYTRRNCMTQCRMEVVRRRCGCYPFYYNFLNGTDGKEVRTCSLSDVSCISNTRYDFLQAMPRVHHHTYCDCPENCEYTTYNMQYSGGGISKNKDIALSSVGHGISIENQTTLRVFFGNIVFIKNNRTREYEFFAILALLGGLLGLFNGISILSLVEIVYWFVVRVLLHIMKAGEKLKTKKQPKVSTNIYTDEQLKIKKQKDAKVSRNVYFIDLKK